MNWLYIFTLKGAIMVTGPFSIDDCCRQLEYTAAPDGVCVAQERPSQKVTKPELLSSPRCFGVSYYNEDRLRKEQAELNAKDRQVLERIKNETKE